MAPELTWPCARERWRNKKWKLNRGIRKCILFHCKWILRTRNPQEMEHRTGYGRCHGDLTHQCLQMTHDQMHMSSMSSSLLECDFLHNTPHNTTATNNKTWNWHGYNQQWPTTTDYNQLMTINNNNQRKTTKMKPIFCGQLAACFTWLGDNHHVAPSMHFLA